MKYKITSKIKRIVGIPIIRVLRIKIFGRHIFINKYTKRVPGLSRLIRRFDAMTAFAHSKKRLETEYKKWLANNWPTKTEIDNQVKQQRKFKLRPMVSIVVPTYNTNPKYLRDCLNSVLNQTYDNWQLCIADDASTNEEVRSIVEEFAQSEPRINYTFRKENGHICKASNSALELSTGEYIGLLDHDDFLWPDALFEIVKTINENPTAEFIYSDEDKIDSHGKVHSEPFLKPDWSFEFLRSINYITHFAVLDKSLVKKVGGFRPGYEGAQDWDLFLRISRLTNEIYHVPKIIYSWRKSESSTAQSFSAKDYAYVNQKKALLDDIKSRGLEAKIEWEIPFSMWRVSYALKTDSLVSIIIPTKDQPHFIRQCLASIKQKTTYKQYELIIVDTGSKDADVWEIYEEYKNLGKNTKVVKWDKPFNFSEACNFGAEHASGEYLLFLNNDTEVITPTWLEDMLGYAQQKDIGAVGCKLYYPDGKIQHAGIILGVGGQNNTPGIAGHFFPAFLDNPPQSPLQLLYIGGTRNFAAVTAACVMVATPKFNAVNGFDPKFRIAFNDVDFCLELRQRGLRNVYLPHVKLYHHESVSVGQPGSKVRDLGEFKKEINMMLEKWRPIIENDPYYHPEFRRDVASAQLKIDRRKQ